jgi:murein L,D-transpeptidase YcbB/YkuD
MRVGSLAAVLIATGVGCALAATLAVLAVKRTEPSAEVIVALEPPPGGFVMGPGETASPTANDPLASSDSAGQPSDTAALPSGDRSTATPAPGAADQTPETSATPTGPDQQAALEPAAEPPAADAPPANDPLLDIIRAKLSDAEIRKNVPDKDLAALESFYAGRSGSSLWMMETGFSPQGQAVLDEIRKADDFGLSSAAFDLPDTTDAPTSEDARAIAEIKLDLAILQYARHARGGRANPPSLSKLIDQRLSLRDPNTVLIEIAAAEAPDAYLRSLHPQHEQFERLRQALIKARSEGGKNVKLILVNMERWRWMPEDLGSLHVWLNVPEFMVHIVKNGKTLYSEKIVVGQLKYATPVFSADLKSIVFNPEWTVPPTIVREDLLPKLRGGGGLFGGGNTAILRQHGLNVRYNGRVVDPSSIDWNRVNMGAISFNQPPGPKNVLGKVKFIYPNSHTVYMHDTIKRELLEKTVRAEGHNCPRVANPGKVAAVILGEDQNMSKAQVEKLLAGGYNSAVGLTHRVPVHTTYFTAVVDDEGKVATFGDIYKLDGAVAAAVIGKDGGQAAVAEQN